LISNIITTSGLPPHRIMEFVDLWKKMSEVHLIQGSQDDIV
jgi:hypothetical protein